MPETRPPVDPDSPPRAPHRRVDALALVFVGGALGTAARYGLARLWPTEPGAWPIGTFVANLVGAFVLGLLLELLLRLGPDTGWRQRLRLFGGTGFCGGFTTYSTLAVESDLLTRSGDTALAAGYLTGTAFAGLAAVVVGMALAGALTRRGAR